MTDHHSVSDDAKHGPQSQQSFWTRWGELLLAAGVIALGIVVLVETQDIRVTRAVARISPRAIPQIVGGGLIVVGIWYAIDVIRAPHLPGGGEDSEDVDPEARTNWTAILVISFGLLCYTLLIEQAGFIIASAVLFFVSAFGMGSRRYVRDGAIAVVLSAGIFLLFDGWLGVRLPGGWFASML